VVVTCEKCETRYRLDESRLTATGSKVRCSRCKHAFTVKAPPAPSGVDAVNEIAQRAASQALAQPPDVTQDLLGFDANDDPTFSGPSPDEAAADESPADAQDEDIEWQFNDEPPAKTRDEPTLERPGSSSADFDFGSLPGGESLELEDASGLRGGQPRAPEALRGGQPRAPEALREAPSNLDEPSDAESASDETPDGGTSLDELGSPENWNLLSDDAPDAGTPKPDPGAGTASSQEAPRGSGVERDSATAATASDDESREKVAIGRIALSSRADVAREAALADSGSSAGRGSPLHSRAANAIGWLAAVALLGVVVHGGVVRPPEAARGSFELAGLRVEDVRGRFVENAQGDTLYVVSGRLRNEAERTRAAGALIQVSLLDAFGSPIDGARAWAAPALADERLRESLPEQLHVDVEARARRLARIPLDPVAELEFAAVFDALPADAARFALQTVSLDRLPSDGQGTGVGSGVPAARPGDAEAPRTETYPR
jgi:predicted Zn finger-like uncharacterized protein